MLHVYTINLYIYYVFFIALVNQLDTSDTVVVNNGQFQVNINNGLPKIYYPQSSQDAPLEEAAPDSANGQKNNNHLSKQ